MILGLFAYVVVPLMDNLTLRWFVKDLDARSQLLASALQEPLQEYVPQKSKKRITQLFDRAIQDERLYALGFCDNNGVLLYKTATYPDSLGCWKDLNHDGVRQSLIHLPQGSVHVADSVLMQDATPLGRLILIHDMSFIERRSSDTKKYVIVFFVLLAVAISLITVVIAHLSWRGWVNGVKDILRGELLPSAQSRTPPEMQPLVGDLSGAAIGRRCAR